MHNLWKRVVWLPLVLSGCLENEEVIEVRADGSVRVSMQVEGDAHDLATGYPLPLHAPWLPADDATGAWLAEVGPDTGSALVQERFRDFRWPGAKPGEAKGSLRVAATFASLADLPRFAAPEGEPYRTAYLERSSTLRIERRGARTVYAFERTFHGRAHAGLALLDGLLEELPEIQAKIETRAPLAPAEWDRIAAAAEGSARAAAERFLRGALLAVYAEGTLEVPSQTFPDLIAAASDRAAATVPAAAFQDVYTRLLAGDDAGVAEGLVAFERDFRAALRDALEEWLAAARLDETARNELRYALEWGFTAFDHTQDVSDETFRVRVRMPGTVVGGNYDALEGDLVTWSFDGKALRDADRVLRVASVLE